MGKDGIVYRHQDGSWTVTWDEGCRVDFSSSYSRHSAGDILNLVFSSRNKKNKGTLKAEKVQQQHQRVWTFKVAEEG